MCEYKGYYYRNKKFDNLFDFSNLSENHEVFIE